MHSINELLYEKSSYDLSLIMLHCLISTSGSAQGDIQQLLAPYDVAELGFL